jgi:hypothetical protein
MPFIDAVNPYSEYDARTPYVPLSEAAEEMGRTTDEILLMARAGLLRSRWSRDGISVQPV